MQGMATKVTVKTLEIMTAFNSMPAANDIDNPVALVRNALIRLPAKKATTKETTF